MTSESPLLEVKALKTYFYTEDGTVRAVDGVDFEVYPGEIVGLVGESGCGKSVTSLSVMRLISAPGKIEQGEILFDGNDLLKVSEQDMIHVRGNRISMIFQQPQTALNPVFKVGNQIGEVLNIHRDFGKEAGYKRAVELLKMVGIPDAERRVEAYPHELSGGQRQRIGIARALALRPKFIICDEPVSALDVSIQSQVLNILKDLQQEFGLTYLFIAHNLSVVEHISDRVAVMYVGKMVELTGRDDLFSNPLHPYTQALMSAIPIPDPHLKRKRIILKGDVPSPLNPPSGCRFHPSCPIAEDNCSVDVPEFRELRPNHWVACHYAERFL